MIKVIFKCGEEVINIHYIPCVGDYIELGEHTSEFKHQEYTPMKKYVVKSRRFSAIEDYNNSYSNKICTVELELI